MADLATLAQSQPAWTLEEFVDCLNQLLPTILPQPLRDDDAINPRLVRYYTSEGLVDRPERQGREARYHYRHLLQVLLVRRLLQEGYGLGAIASLLQNKANAELEALLHGGVQLTLETANPALAFLQSLKAAPLGGSKSLARSSRGTSPINTPPSGTSPSSASAKVALPKSSPAPTHLSQPTQKPPAHSPAGPAAPDLEAPDSEAPAPEQWWHVPVLPGLMLLIRADFKQPQTQQEQQNLSQLILDKLRALTR